MIVGFCVKKNWANISLEKYHSCAIVESSVWQNVLVSAPAASCPQWRFELWRSGKPSRSQQFLQTLPAWRLQLCRSRRLKFRPWQGHCYKDIKGKQDWQTQLKHLESDSESKPKEKQPWSGKHSPRGIFNSSSCMLWGLSLLEHPWNGWIRCL